MPRVFWPFLGALHLLALLAISTDLPLAVGFGRTSFALSALAFALYAWDKAAAKRSARRVSEKTLHAIALLGGWPGAALAGAVFHHKTQKPAFQNTFAWVVALNALATYATLHFTARWPVSPQHREAQGHERGISPRKRAGSSTRSPIFCRTRLTNTGVGAVRGRDLSYEDGIKGPKSLVHHCDAGWA